MCALTERLLDHDLQLVRGIVDDGRLDHKVVAVLDLGAAKGEFIPVVVGVQEELLDDVVLHLVLHGTEQVARVGRGRTDLPRLHDLGQRLQELLVDVLVHVDALARHAELTRVEERAHRDLRRDVLDVHVGADDAAVVPAQLQRDTLQRLARGRHDLLARSDGPGEADLAHVRVLAQQRAGVVIAVQGLDDARREDVSDQLGELQDAVRRVRGRLRDHAVAGDQGGADLGDGEGEWEVPGADGGDDADGHVAQAESQVVVVLDDLRLEFGVFRFSQEWLSIRGSSGYRHCI